MNGKGLNEFRSSLTSHESNDSVTTYRNTASIACPTCGEPFDDLVACENDYNSLELSMMLDLCVTQHDDDAFLFMYKRGE